MRRFRMWVPTATAVLLLGVSGAVLGAPEELSTASSPTKVHKKARSKATVISTPVSGAQVVAIQETTAASAPAASASTQSAGASATTPTAASAVVAPQASQTAAAASQASSSPSGDASQPTWFWAGFWPNVAATLIGVFLGVPAALWVNSKWQSVLNRRSAAETKAHLRRGLELVRDALKHNLAVLITQQDLLASKKSLVDLDLNLAAWEATKALALTHMGQPEVYEKLALYFERVSSLVRVHTLYIDSGVGVASSLTNALNTQSLLEGAQTTLITKLRSDSESLVDEVGVEIERLA